jgi:hypothetical protein
MKRLIKDLGSSKSSTIRIFLFNHFASIFVNNKFMTIELNGNVQRALQSCAAAGSHLQRNRAKRSQQEAETFESAR